MNRFRSFAVIALLLPVAGCVSSKETAANNKLADSANRLITCHAGADCDEKWQRVGQWVKSNSTYPIVTQTQDRIETNGPSGLFDDHSAFTIIKKPGLKKTPEAAPENYTIALFPRCDNWLGCTPSALKVEADFATFVIGPPVPKPALGVKVTPLSLEMAQKMQMPGTQGLVITAVMPHSPADEAELSDGDIIVHYNGVLVLTEDALKDLVNNTPPGKRATLDVIRGRAHQAVTIDFPVASAK